MNTTIRSTNLIFIVNLQPLLTHMVLHFEPQYFAHDADPQGPCVSASGGGKRGQRLDLGNQRGIDFSLTQKLRLCGLTFSNMNLHTA